MPKQLYAPAFFKAVKDFEEKYGAGILQVPDAATQKKA